ncbi:alkaline phosphatase [Bacterioplanoides sp.]|uniref:alkaline phosphatase n=1 Tax=Bacterioplanoides sp. TaxID=2066072 RepID=UPI003B59C46F
MRRHFISSLLLFGAVLTPLSNASEPLSGTPDFHQGQQWLQQRLQQRQQQSQFPSKANNLMLFLGDGMSITTLTAARIFQGQRQGNSGEENNLSFESFPYSALIKTYNTNQQTPDSAGTMSAITTGVKTRAGVIALGPEQDRAICAGWQNHKQQTLLQWAQQHNFATGIVTTARLTHATPAATYAHSPERGWEADSDITSEAEQHGCKDIAWQLIHQAFPAGLDLAMGGGKRNFITPEQHKKGKRDDGNLIADWQTQFPDGQYIETQQQLAALHKNLDTSHSSPVLGLFANSHLAYHQDAPDSQPRLQQMTEVAVAYLKHKVKTEKLRGYILIVEGARIDHGHHLGNAYRALDETVEFSAAIAAAEQQAGDDTLLVVTADHSHTLSMAGYPERGNPILGFTHNHGLTLAADNQPYTTLGYANGAGGSSSADHTHRQAGRIYWHGSRHNAQHNDPPKAINPMDPDFYQAALGEKSYETHGSDDVALHAQGPGAQLFHGLLEQHSIYHLIRRALGLPTSAQTASAQTASAQTKPALKASAPTHNAEEK